MRGRDGGNYDLTGFELSPVVVPLTAFVVNKKIGKLLSPITVLTLQETILYIITILTTVYFHRSIHLCFFFFLD